MKTTLRVLRVTLLIMAAALYSVGYAVAQTCVVPPSGLVSWWPGDGNANDIQNGNHGTLVNGATFATGKVGQAFSFDGVDDYVQIPHNDNLDPGTGSFSLDAWVKTTQATGSQIIVSKYECGQTCISEVTNSAYLLSVRDGKLVGFLRDTDKGGPPADDEGQSLIGTTSVADGAFHHVAMVRDLMTGELRLRLYVDGMLDASAPLNAGATGAIKDDDGEADPFLIGAFIEGGTTTRVRFFSGLIDEVEFYNRALSASEIYAIFNAGSAGKCKGPAYACAGFASPFNVPILLKAKVNRAIPVQMQLFSDGTPITDTNIAGAPPVVNVTYSAGIGPAVDVTDQLDPVGQSSEGNQFSYDPAAGHWIFHLGTKPFTAAGMYTVTVAPGDTGYTVSPTCTGQFVRSD